MRQTRRDFIKTITAFLVAPSIVQNSTPDFRPYPIENSENPCCEFAITRPVLCNLNQYHEGIEPPFSRGYREKIFGGEL